MRSKLTSLAVGVFILSATLHIHAQGYIVPNGVTYGGFNGVGYAVNVIHDPTNGYATGFFLDPVGKTPPTSTYTNTFRFDPLVDIGVRAFLVSSNDPVSLQPILAHSYTELVGLNSYVFSSGSPFYVGLYTGNDRFAPPTGIYNDPLFGWAQLVNNHGIIELLGGALEYQGGGIFAGTQNIIPVPEPSTFGLLSVGVLFLGWRAARRNR